MAFFKKYRETRNKNKLKKKFGYRVTISDPMSNTTRDIKTFYANKVRDDDGVVWLSNDKEFREIFPLDSKEDIPYTREQIEKKIQKLKSKPINKNENELNRQSEMLKLVKMLKAMNNIGGSFIKVDKDGMPHIEYVRYRSSFVPLKRNVEFSTIHVPEETLIKSVLRSTLEKKEKYKQGMQTIITLGLIAFFVLNLIHTGSNAYWSYKLNNWADDSNLARMQSRIDEAPLICAEMYSKAGENFYESSILALNITQTINGKVSPTVRRDTQSSVLE